MKGNINVTRFKPKSTRGSLSNERKNVKTNCRRGPQIVSCSKQIPIAKYQMVKAENFIIESNNFKNDKSETVSQRRLNPHDLLTQEDYETNLRTFKSNGENILRLNTSDKNEDENVSVHIDNKNDLVTRLNNKVKVMEEKINKLEDCIHSLMDVMDVMKTEPRVTHDDIKYPKSIKSMLVYPKVSRTVQVSRTGSTERKKVHFTNENVSTRPTINKSNYMEKLYSVKRRTEMILQSYDKNSNLILSKLKNKFISFK